LRLGLPQVFKYHYTPGMHENNSIGELGFNLDVWKSFTPQQQEAANSAVKDTFITWITRWQKQNADAMEEMVQKHGARILRTPPDILLASLKAWDEVAKENSDKSPTFKKVYESQRAYAAKVVPAKRYMFPPYSFAASDEGWNRVTIRNEPEDSYYESRQRIMELTLYMNATVQQHYGRASSRTLIMGGSNGGHHTKWMLEDFPYLYDGGLAGYGYNSQISQWGGVAQVVRNYAVIAPRIDDIIGKRPADPAVDPLKMPPKS